MHPAIQICLGVLPATFMTAAGSAFISIHPNGRNLLLLACGFMGTSGLIWFLIGFSRRSAPVVLALLLAGILGMLPLALRAVPRLFSEAEPGRIMEALLMSWLLLGPVIVGVYQSRVALRRLRAVA